MNERKTSNREKLFAKFLAKEDEASFEMHKNKKTELFKDISGTVVEIGPGTGVNFPFLNNQIVNWTGIEPNKAMHPFLVKNANDHGFEITIKNDRTENISIDSSSIDFVISSEVLCSVNNLKQSLNEVRRILKPGGKFLFLEHVADNKVSFRRLIQKIVPLTPWRYFSDGCRPGRQIGKAIKENGFHNVNYKRYMQAGKGIILEINRPHIYGLAIK